jgi:hypothetical protein
MPQLVFLLIFSLYNWLSLVDLIVLPKSDWFHIKLKPSKIDFFTVVGRFILLQINFAVSRQLLCDSVVSCSAHSQHPAILAIPTRLPHAFPQTIIILRFLSTFLPEIKIFFYMLMPLSLQEMTLNAFSLVRLVQVNGSLCLILVLCTTSLGLMFCLALIASSFSRKHI